MKNERCLTPGWASGLYGCFGKDVSHTNLWLSGSSEQEEQVWGFLGGGYKKPTSLLAPSISTKSDQKIQRSKTINTKQRQTGPYAAIVELNSENQQSKWFTDLQTVSTITPRRLWSQSISPNVLRLCFRCFISYSCLVLDVATLLVLHTNVCGVSNKPSSGLLYIPNSECMLGISITPI